MAFDENTVRLVWEKGRKVDGVDEGMFRKDACGAWIMRDKYGKTHPFGWVIDHIFPVSKGGTCVLENLRPLQYQNNISKADDYPSYTASVTSEGEKNVSREQNLTVNSKTREMLAKIYNG